MTYPYLFGSARYERTGRGPRLKAIMGGRVAIVIVKFCWIYIGANTISEILVGPAVGYAYGLLFQLFIYYVVRPRAHKIVLWRVCQLLSLVNAFLAYDDRSGASLMDGDPL